MWAVLIVAGLIALVLLVVIARIVHALWKKGRVGKTFVAIVAAGLGWSIYDAISPSDSFYTEELNRLVNIQLPADAVVVEKNATFPDQFGDYSACFTVRLTPGKLVELQKQFKIEPEEEQMSTSCGSTGRLTVRGGKVVSYDLSQSASREDAMVFVSLIPETGLATFSWYLW